MRGNNVGQGYLFARWKEESGRVNDESIYLYIYTVRLHMSIGIYIVRPCKSMRICHPVTYRGKYPSARQPCANVWLECTVALLMWAAVVWPPTRDGYLPF